MTGSHVVLDHVLLVLIVVVWPVAEWRYFYPRSVREIKSGVDGAQRRLYRNILLPEWGFTAGVVALWMARGRSWELLQLGAGTPVRMGIGLTIAALILCLLWAQRRTILGRPKRLELVRRKLGDAIVLAPHTLSEFRIFTAVAITAGICEEILFRGFVMWYIAAWFSVAWLGAVVAVAVSSVLFGFAHIYLGRRHVGSTAAAGVFFALLVLACGSLWPAMIVHAAVDLSSGELGYEAYRAGSANGADSASGTVV